MVLTIPFLLKEVKRTGGSEKKKFLLVQETDNSLLEWEIQLSVLNVCLGCIISAVSYV